VVEGNAGLAPEAGVTAAVTAAQAAPANIQIFMSELFLIAFEVTTRWSGGGSK
jgi:hypothetical protein